MTATETIALLISDMDGTLLTPEKSLSAATIAAVQALDRAGIGFTVISSRPPRGMATAVKALNVRLPFGAFNGGSVVEPDLRVSSAQRLTADCALAALAVLAEAGVGIWVFADDAWLLTDPAGFRLERERRTMGFDPVVVGGFESVIDRIDKIMGVSEHHDQLKAAEARVHMVLGDRAHADCSNPFYLDITPPDANKGAGVQRLCARIGTTPAATAVIGDMSNDVPMFRVGGLSIAMGQAPTEVRQAALFTTSSNAEDGFARAVEQHILGAPSG